MMPSTLDSICSEIVDCEHKSAPIDAAGAYYAVGTPAMKGNVIDYSESRRISRDTFESWTRRLRPRHGDLLLAREAPVGPVVQIPRAENVAPGQRTVLLRPDPRTTHSRFLYYYLSAPKQQAMLQVNAAGSTVAHLNVADVRSFPVEIPDLAQQRAIAEVLGALDDKIAANTKLAHTANALSENIFDQKTESLAYTTLDQVVTPMLGGTPARSDNSLWSGDNPWASARDIASAQFGIVLSTEETISDTATRSRRFAALPAGSVILTARGTVGAVARLGVDASINQSCYGFRSDKLPRAVLYLSVKRAGDEAKALAHGSVFDTITMRSLHYLRVPKFESRRLIELESQLTPLLDIVEGAAKENRRLTETRDALLPQLMSGRLRVKDAEAVAESVL